MSMQTPNLENGLHSDRYVKSLFIDESGNSGDLIDDKNKLSFGGQPTFSLAGVDISNIPNLEGAVKNLKEKHRVQAPELKASGLYKSKPQFILEIFSLLIQHGSPFFVEVVDKKYYLATSIATHQIIPPYFTDEKDGKQQVSRNLAANFMALKMPDLHYEDFINSCLNPSEGMLLNSMESIKKFFLSDSEYGVYSKNIEASVEDYYDLKRLHKDDAVKKFIPIPDVGKRSQNHLIHLLPHVSSFTNLVARVNLANNRNLEGVSFLHDKQDHFDEILNQIKGQMVCSGAEKISFPTPNSDFHIKTNIDLVFSDSKKTLGVQIADLLAGFFVRYYEGLLSGRISHGDIYHKIYSKLSEGFDQNKSVGVNWVIPPSRLYELESFHHLGCKISPTSEQLLDYIMWNLGVELLFD